jgi:DNA-binding transcriptional LysR family regulator
MNQASRLNLRALRAFAEVYRWRKLNAAAERLHLTPSAVSVLVRQLEESVGTRLFDRTTRALSPTAAATQMLPLVERILRDVQSVESDFRTPDVVKGRIAIAVTPLMRRFEELHPQIHVSLIDGEASQFVPRILADEVDFGVGSPGQSLGDLTQRTLIQDHLCVACLATHPLAQRKTVRWADLRHHKLVTVKAGYGIRGAIDEAARKAGVRLDFHHEVSMLTTALAMTASGLGVAIVSGELVALTGFSALTVRKIERPVVVRNISIVTRRKRTLSMAAELFISHMQAQLAQSRG